ncbi:MAG: HAD-superfamily hydrolase, subfamily variant 1 [Deltaproteobacteria bacterium]|nr:HAD-superfamily hydrolase, subfamily variant 1 [Deltaproteobacteria bacterium]
MRPLPSAVTFDCWNTLLSEENWHEAHRRRVDALLHAARESGARVDFEQAGCAFDRAWHHHMTLWIGGVASGAREVASWAMHDLRAPTHGATFELLVAHFENASHSSRVVPLEGAVETVAALARAGVPAALICDTGLTPGRVVRKHLARVGLLDGLRAQLFSDEVGVPKPDARIFRAALAALGVAARGAVHVGDLLRTDVAGARNVGMQSVRLRATHDDATELPEADHVAASHAELRAIFGVL